jgi:hypothetical protein
MNHLGGRDTYSTILHDNSAPLNLMGTHQWPKRWAVLVNLSDANVVRFVSEVIIDHSPHRRWSPAFNRFGQTRQPRELQQWTKLDVVVGVVMGNEDVSKLGQRKPRHNHLMRNSVAAVDDIDAVAVDDCLSRTGSVLTGSRTSRGPQKNQASATKILSRT